MITLLRQRWTPILVLVAVVLAIGFVTLLPSPACSSATGCVFHSNASPRLNGNCVSQAGSGCYLCEYSSSGGGSTCAENNDGSIKYCIHEEHQDIVP
jgi:hypothetical protein